MSSSIFSRLVPIEHLYGYVCSGEHQKKYIWRLFYLLGVLCAHVLSTFVMEKEREQMNIEKGKIERGDEVYANLSLSGKTIV